MPSDLGPYWVRVMCANGEGFLYRWETGRGFCEGNSHCKPLGARQIPCGYDTDTDVIETVRFMFTEGNLSCDCNLFDMLDDANQRPRSGGLRPCGDSLSPVGLSVLRPNVDVWEVIDAE